MGTTIAQGILARQSGEAEVLPGEIVQVEVDLMQTRHTPGVPPSSLVFSTNTGCPAGS